jgi:glycosyltransferase involved in cell wall biosynthesis
MDDRRKLKLVVMMSALNEEKTIGRVIDDIPRDMGAPMDVAVVVVDDGSDDATRKIAAEKGAIVVQHGRRMGLGRSFADGLERTLEEGADVVVNMDADGQFDPRDIPALIRPILEDRADFVTATRFSRKDMVPEMPWIKRWGNKQMCRLVNFATGTTALTDASCGFRAYNLKAALHVHLSGGLTHVQETIIDLANKGLRITEVPLRIRGVREHGASRVAAFLPRYAFRAGGIVLRTFCRTRPLLFFGVIGGTIMALGIAQGLVVFAHWCLTRQTSPVRSLLITASLFITVGFLILVLAFVADMLDRITDVSERLLFYTKLDRYRRQHGDSDSSEL